MLLIVVLIFLKTYERFGNVGSLCRFKGAP